MSVTARPYDLVVWGATGVAGKLVVDYLTEEYTPSELALAIAGRNKNRLDAVRRDVVEKTEWNKLPVILGNAEDPESLEEMAEQTQVVCTTVGPYTKYGTPLVEACISTGTDYCDLTGEVNWIREMVDRYHDRAADADVRIIHSCGFDSVPADLGTLLVQAFAIETYDRPCTIVRIYIEDGKGGISGGTLASAVEVFKAVSENPIARATLENPYSLAPPDERTGIDTGIQRMPQKDSITSEWTAPSPMAIVNERVIRRSNALLEYPWGRDFQCSEVVPTGHGAEGALKAIIITGGLAAGKAGLSIEPLRSALQRFVFPDPGKGPTREETARGSFTVRILGSGVSVDGPFSVQGRISADQGPGYGATARMLSEAAMCLVNNEIESPLSGGVLTPASGIGMPLSDRLQNAGLTVSVGQFNE